VGSGSLKKECKNPEPFRSYKGSKGSGFLRLMVMQQLLPYSEGEDLEKLESFTAQTAADNDGLTAALPRRVLFCEMPGRMCRRTGLFCALARRAKKEISFHSFAVGRTKLCQMREISQKKL